MSVIPTGRTAAPRPGVARPGGHADDWLRALEELFVVPPEYRAETVDRIGALNMLRCGEDILDELVRHGLPCSGRFGDERFERYDLFNLALYSGSERSTPETGIQFALRWMGHPPDSWFAPRSWDLSVDLSCPRSDGCGSEPRWSLARPEPEAFGGRLVRVSAGPGELLERDGELSTEGTGSFSVHAVVVTAGQRRQLESRRLREIFSEYDEGGHRWVRLPVELQARPELVLSSGVAPCISVSLDLAAKCRAAGFEARTRRGWLLGMLDLAHAWLEVVDEDGEWKTVDPVFALLADHAVAPHPQFRPACAGSRFNRLLPSSHQADRPLAGHSCAGTGRSPHTRSAVRMIREEPPATTVPATTEGA